MLREFSSPAPDGSPSAPNLCAHLIENARTHPDQVVFHVRRDGRMIQITAAEFHDEVREVAKGLMSQGVVPEVIRATWMRVLKFFFFPITHEGGSLERSERSFLPSSEARDAE